MTFCLADYVLINHFKVKTVRLATFVSFLYTLAFSGGFAVCLIYWGYEHHRLDISNYDLEDHLVNYIKHLGFFIFCVIELIFNKIHFTMREWSIMQLVLVVYFFIAFVIYKETGVPVYGGLTYDNYITLGLISAGFIVNSLGFLLGY